MSEPINGSPVEIRDVAGMTVGELFALTIGDLVGELKSKDLAEDILILEASTLPIENAPPLKVRVMVTIDERGDKYVNAVTARMRKEAQRRHDAEVRAAKERARGDRP